MCVVRVKNKEDIGHIGHFGHRDSEKPRASYISQAVGFIALQLWTPYFKCLLFPIGVICIVLVSSYVSTRPKATLPHKFVGYKPSCGGRLWWEMVDRATQICVVWLHCFLSLFLASARACLSSFNALIISFFSFPFSMLQHLGQLFKLLSKPYPGIFI